MNEEQTDLRKEVTTPNELLDTGDLARSAKWIYKHYGTDLTSFFSDAYKAEARKRRGESQESHNVEVCP
jgi:hypothetical protein